MAQKFTIEGLSELDEALQEIPKATARNVLLRVLMRRGQAIADAEKSYAPRLTGELAMSPAVSTKLTRRQRSQNPKDSDVEVYVGPTPHAKSVQTEFGNARQAPHPHLRPAWDANVMGVLQGITQDIADEIEKARKRIAKKAERLAAQMGK